MFTWVCDDLLPEIKTRIGWMCKKIAKVIAVTLRLWFMARVDNDIIMQQN